MPRPIRKEVAQQIVDTVKDLCGHDINLIDTNGIIFASTDRLRVGDFHEIGRQVFLRERTIEVEADDSFFGTQKGVNIPIRHHGEIVAVTGITGEPEEVRKFATLAQRMTTLIIREHEVDVRSHTEQTEKNYIIRSLISGENLNRDYLEAYLAQFHMDLKSVCRTVLIRLNSRYNPSDFPLVEGKIRQAFSKTGSALYTFNYPNEYILLLETDRWDRWSDSIRSLAEDHQEIINVGIGVSRPLICQSQSFESAALAIRSLTEGLNFAIFDQLDLEILLGDLSEKSKKQFCEKIISCLDEKEQKLLGVYFTCDMSLKESCERLFIHKNTLQYQLDKIWRISGYNPRCFRDAVVLYLGLRMKDSCVKNPQRSPHTPVLPDGTISLWGLSRHLS